MKAKFAVSLIVTMLASGFGAYASGELKDTTPAGKIQQNGTASNGVTGAIGATGIAGQANNQATNGQAAGNTGNPAPKPPVTPQILSVATQRPNNKRPDRNGPAFAGDVIRIKISHPQEFLESKPLDKSKLLLFIDGIPFDGIYATYFDQYSKNDIKNKIYTLQDTITVPFVLLRNADTKSTWDYLYRKSGWLDSHIKVEASLGWEGMFPLTVAPAIDNQFTIVYYHDLVLVPFMFLYLAFILFFIYIALTTNMLCDIPATGKKRGPYSLAQTQLAFWTIIIVGGFIYTLVLTDITSSLNTSVLLLLGISVSTTGIASYIDYYKKTQTSPTVKPKKPEGFLQDILSDNGTYSVQRIQTAIWNLVLGVYFICFTILNKSMPVFPDVLLSLAGVSSLAYVAGKGTEKN